MIKYRVGERYVRKIGTKDIFPYTDALWSRGDMEEYYPFSTNRTRQVTDPDHKFLNYVKQTVGLDREHVREELGKLKFKSKKLFWCLYHIWLQTSGIELKDFKPKYRQLSILMGPIFTHEDLEMALRIFKKNPNLPFLMSEEADELIGTC